MFTTHAFCARPSTANPRRVAAMAVAIAAALTLGACGNADRPELVSPVASTSTSVPVTATTEVSTEIPVAPIRAISTVEKLNVFSGPESDVLVEHFDATTDFGSATVLLVETITEDWVEVQLPVRPNGSTGWVRAGDVTLERLDTAVVVDLETRQLSVWRDGALHSTSSVAIGSVENPTPVGSFFITDKIDTTNDAGAYGPYAIGLSAFSETLTEFAGGEGQIGIHGTNDPASIGEAVSHGCVRLPNDVITQLATELPLGTPVVIS